MDARTEKTLEHCTDKEIRDEYADRFGDIDEMADLIAEAARISPHAVRAYELLLEREEGLPALRVRQAIIAGRMAEVA